MHKYILIGLCFLAITISEAQTLTIRNAETRHPIEMVSVYSLNPTKSAFSDTRGRVDMEPFMESDTLYFRLLGYKPLQMSLNEVKNQNYEVFLTESNFSLQEVTISVSRWEQEKKDVPNKISSIKPEDVYFQNPQTAADMLSISDEVYIQKSQLGGGSPMIRGFATNRVLLVVDGVRMNNAIFRSGNLQNVISLDPLGIQSSEIIFGPGSVIYGSDAIGGVMSFYTINPSLSNNSDLVKKGSTYLRYSSANTENTRHVDFSLGSQRLGSATSFTYSNYEDLIMGRNGPADYLRPSYSARINGVDTMLVNSNQRRQRPTEYRQINITQKLRYQPIEKIRLDYGFHYSTTSSYPRYDRQIRYGNGSQLSAEWYYGPQEWMMHSLGILHSGENKVYNQSKLTLAYQHFEESRHSRDFGDPLLTNRYEEVDALSLNLDFEKKVGQLHSIFYGLEGVYNKIGSTGFDINIDTQISTAAASRYPNGSTWQSYAGYINYLFRASNKLTLQGGVRYNHILLESDFDTTFYPFPFSRARINSGAFTGSAGLAWLPKENWQFNLNFSTGFRSPNVDDVGKVFDSEPGSVIIPNPNLKPEYAYNFEGAITHIIGEVAKIDLTGYYTILNDAMVRRNSDLSGMDSIIYDGQLSQVQSIQNSAEAYVYGIQAGIEVKLPFGFSLKSNINFQEGKEELDDGSKAPLRHAAPMFGSTHLFWKKGRFKADIYCNYNGKLEFEDLAPEEQNKPYLYASDANGNPWSPSWYTLNFKVMYHANNYLTANIGLENITNQRYRPYSSGIAAPGINLIASVRVNF